MTKSRTYIATPPGVTVKEQLVNRCMSQKEFATRMDMSEKHISKFLNGDVILTPDMANRLEMVLGLPASFWNNLESIYREKLVLVKEENEMDKDKEILKKFPYSNMAKLGWVEATKDSFAQIRELRKFFEVVKLSLIDSSLLPGINYKSYEENFSLIVWAQKARIESRNVETKPININAIKSNLKKIKTTKPDELANLLAEYGIALIYMPKFDENNISGATFYENNKIVIGVINDDNLYFNIFHEIGHILLGHINEDYVKTGNEEKDADAFSKRNL